MTPRDAAAAITELRKSGRLAEAIQASKEALTTWPDDRSVRQAVGWCLWARVRDLVDTDINDRSWARVVQHLSSLRRWALDAATPTGYTTYDPFPLTVTTVMRAAKRQKMPARAIEAAAFADPMRLPRDRNGDYPSSLMSWLLQLTWAYDEVNEWGALLQLESRVTTIPREPGREWVVYRFALAHEGTGDLDGALRLFDAAFPSPTNSWQLVVRARLLLGAGDQDAAVLEARRSLAATKRGDLLLSIDALHVIARALAQSDAERALAHASIVKAIRDEKGYAPDSKMRTTLAALKVTDVVAADARTHEEQAKWWQAAESEQRLTGRVIKHLAHGGAGFIAGDDGLEYYFDKKRTDTRPLLAIGTRVSFTPHTSFDAKKNRSSLKAIKVRSM